MLGSTSRTFRWSMNSSPIQSLLSRPWWYPVVAVGLVLILATASSWRWVSPINLAGENNLAAWWSGALYLVAAVHAYQVSRRCEGGARGGWHLFSLGMLVMVCTEVGSLHERLGYVVIGAIGALLGSSFLLLYRVPEYRTNALWLAGGVAMNASAVAQEWLEWSREWTGWAIGVRAAAEEGSELVASLLMLTAAMRASATRGQVRDLFEPLLPSKELSRIVMVSLVPALLLAYFGTTRSDMVNRGNPSACYPMLIYLVSACLVLSSELRSERGPRAHRLLLAALLVFFSVDSMWQLYWNATVYYPNPDADHSVSQWASYLPYLSLVHVGLTLVWALGCRGFWRGSKLGIVAGILLFAVVATTTEGRAMQLLTGTVTAFGIYCILDRSGAWYTESHT